jgi:hypothetical protein
MAYRFKGPARRVQKTGAIRPLKNPDILEAYVIWKRKRYELFQNEFDYRIMESGRIFVYHSYYFETDTGIYSGRWYNMEFPAGILQTIGADNTLTVEIPEYEDEATGKTFPAKFVIRMTQRAANILRAAS